ncbi:hypothetical protein AYI68_g5617 [Smittium mucronatum]|uniref:Uncharacterized protein n=1 Tax=Smittium mucronatum TaxID=133383 RepID=A0A1R0GTR9_9FUNG|nr:hypothetical protein AYI68_g5617 [Smittium mucronatum]
MYSLSNWNSNTKLLTKDLHHILLDKYRTPPSSPRKKSDPFSVLFLQTFHHPTPNYALTPSTRAGFRYLMDTQSKFLYLLVWYFKSLKVLLSDLDQNSVY